MNIFYNEKDFDFNLYFPRFKLVSFRQLLLSVDGSDKGKIVQSSRESSLGPGYTYVICQCKNRTV